MSDAPEPYTWYIRGAGDTDTRVFTWQDEGVPINLTNYTAKLVIDHSGVKTEINVTSGIIAAEGKVTATIPKTVTDDFRIATGTFRLTVESAAGNPTTIAFGPLIVMAK